MFVLLLLLVLMFFVGVPVWVAVQQGKITELEARVSALEGAPRRSAAAKKVTAPAAVLTAKSSSAPVPSSSQTAPHIVPRSLEERVGGHLFQWIGIGALVLALLYFLKLSYDLGWINQFGRTVIGYALAVLAMVIGHRFRHRYGPWALTFTGGGALGAYVVTWIAQHSYGLLSQAGAFAIFLLVAIGTCAFAMLYHAPGLAAFGIAGGFLTPMLAGEHRVTLFILGYVTLLSIGIVLIAFARKWHGLTLFGLIGVALYQINAISDNTVSQGAGIAIAVILLLAYAAVPYVASVVRGEKANDGDVIALLLNAVVHFGIILLWLGETDGLREQWDAAVALAFAALFCAYAWQAWRGNRQDTHLIYSAFSLAALFLALVMPLHFGREWAAFAWGLEGGLLMILGLRLDDARIRRIGWSVIVSAIVWYIIGSRLEWLFIYGTLEGWLLVGLLVYAVIALASPRNAAPSDHNALLILITTVLLFAVGLFLNEALLAGESLTAIERFVEILALAGGTYGALWYARQRWDALLPADRRLLIQVGVAVHVAVLAYLTNEFRLLTEGTRWSYSAVQVGISLLWALYAAATLVVGAMNDWRHLRLFGIAVLLVATAKLSIFDFWELGTAARVVGFSIVGLLLIGSSFYYQKRVHGAGDGKPAK